MISIKLLSEVLGKKVIRYDNELQILFYRDEYDSMVWAELNIYELAHKCKEWAWRNYHYTLSSEYADNEYSCSATLTWHDFKNYPCTIEEYPIVSDTEPEAIFKACQWILDNKRKMK